MGKNGEMWIVPVANVAGQKGLPHQHPRLAVKCQRRHFVECPRLEHSLPCSLWGRAGLGESHKGHAGLEDLVKPMLFYSDLILCSCVLSDSRQDCIWAGKGLCHMLIWIYYKQLLVWFLCISGYLESKESILVYIQLWWLWLVLMYLNCLGLQLCGSTELKAGYILFNQFISPFCCTNSALALKHLDVAETEL